MITGTYSGLTKCWYLESSEVGEMPYSTQAVSRMELEWAPMDTTMGVIHHASFFF